MLQCQCCLWDVIYFSFYIYIFIVQFFSFVCEIPFWGLMFSMAFIKLNLSGNMRFTTMWYVQPAKPHISLCIHAVWSEPLLVAWVFYECWATEWTPFGVSKLKWWLHRLVWVYTFQNATLFEITCNSSFLIYLCMHMYSYCCLHYVKASQIKHLFKPKKDKKKINMKTLFGTHWRNKWKVKFIQASHLYYIKLLW